jgi:tyrosine-protein phosphatase SIW14
MAKRVFVCSAICLLAAAACPAVERSGACFSSIAGQPNQQPMKESSAKKIRRELIPDFGEITPTLFRGAQPRKHGFEALAKMGIQIVVDLRGDRRREREEVTRLGMLYVPMRWECSFPKDEIFAQFLTLLRKNPGKKVFIHCKVGDDRTGMMVAAYRMAEQGWSAPRAMEEMKAYGFNFLHRNFICMRLASYEKHFPERFATEPAFKELRSSDSNVPLHDTRHAPAETEHSLQ